MYLYIAGKGPCVTDSLTDLTSRCLTPIDLKLSE